MQAVQMENFEVKEKMQELAKRAQQRRTVLSAVKSEVDAQEENKHFEELKLDIYKNIMRSDY